MTEIVIPQLDANSETVKLVRWEVADGASVAKGDTLCTVETSKAIYEVEAEASGVSAAGAAGRHIDAQIKIITLKINIMETKICRINLNIVFLRR